MLTRIVPSSRRASPSQEARKVGSGTSSKRSNAEQPRHPAGTRRRGWILQAESRGGVAGLHLPGAGLEQGLDVLAPLEGFPELPLEPGAFEKFQRCRKVSGRSRWPRRGSGSSGGTQRGSLVDVNQIVTLENPHGQPKLPE